MVKDGEIYAGFATIDPHGVILTDSEADDVAEAFIACWNGCSEAGLSVADLKAGIIRMMVDYLSCDAVLSDGTVTFEI